MRFKNLTIILTLACLSIVAFAGLVLLPITNVICYDGDDWTTYDDGYAANYYASQNEDNRSWYLMGDVQARGVKASGSVSILSKDRFSKNWKKMGNTSVSVFRDNYTWYHRYVAGFLMCNNCRMIRRRGSGTILAMGTPRRETQTQMLKVIPDLNLGDIQILL